MVKIDFDPRIIGNKILSDGTKKESAVSLERQAWRNSHGFNILMGSKVDRVWWREKD